MEQALSELVSNSLEIDGTGNPRKSKSRIIFLSFKLKLFPFHLQLFILIFPAAAMWKEKVRKYKELSHLSYV